VCDVDNALDMRSCDDQLAPASPCGTPTVPAEAIEEVVDLFAD
jgi:hypothetical protein